MSTDLSKPAPASRDVDDSFETDASGRWKGVAVLLAGGALAAAGGGWLGYRSQAGASTETASAATSQREPSAKVDTRSDGNSLQPPRVAPVPPVPTSRSNVALPPLAATPGMRTDAAGVPLLSWPMWEFRLRQPIPPRAPSLTPPPWRLIGSSLAAGKRSIIVLRQGKSDPEYFSVGQELPGGYRVVAIDDQDVTLAQGPRTMVLSYIGSR